MSDVSGTTTYGYDNRNRLTSKQTPFGTLSYTYDAASNLLTLKSSNSGGISDTYTYDTLNRLSTVTDASGTTTYAYDAVGNLQNFVYPNSVTHAYSYDTLNRLTQMGSSKNANAISNYAYTLGVAGNRLTVAELSGRNVVYGYDSLYRLTSETVTSDPNNHNFTNGFTYDAVGNRQQWLVNGTVTNSYSYDADDRLGSDQYDADGNTTTSLGTANTYDFENHMLTHGSVTMVYDGDGNRVSETAGGVTTKYLVDTTNPTGYAQVVDELVGGSVARTYSYGSERISETQSISGAATTSFYGYDGHGSVRQLTNSTGAVTDTYDYDAFGNLINSTGSTPNNYLFAGEQFDPALGLYYNRARYLNTTTGRFWSMDLFEGHSNNPATLHKYLYVEADPVNMVDHCGYCAPSNSEIGGIVEDDVFRQYRAYTLGTGVQSAPLFTLAAPNGNSIDYAGRGLMPDLANIPTKEFYEIKSIYSLGAAEDKVYYYQYYLNQADQAWHPGEGFTPNLFTRVDASSFAIVFNAGPGVISYCVISRNELLGIAGVLLMIAGIAGVAGEAGPQIEEELDNPQLYPTPVPVGPGISLPSVELAGEELEVGAAALLE